MDEILTVLGMLFKALEPKLAVAGNAALDALARWLATLEPTIAQQLETGSAKIASDMRLAHTGDPNWTVDELEGEITEAIRIFTVNLTGAEPPHPAAVPLIATAALLRTLPPPA